jgi:hypothetical protein
MKFSRELVQFLQRFFDPQDQKFHDQVLSDPHLAVAHLPPHEAKGIEELLRKRDAQFISKPSSSGWW